MTQPQPDGADHARLVELLRSLGASEDEIVRTPLEQRSALALEVALRDGRPPVPLASAAAAIGTAPDDLVRFWRALGFVGDGDDVMVPAALVDAQRVLATTAVELIGDEATLGLARVIGASTTRLAEAVVDTFRVGFELPELDRGVRYSDVVASYVELAQTALPAFESIVMAALRAHLVQVAAGNWAPDIEGTATRRRLAVGFADLVGYTALSRTLAPAQLASLLRRFEDGVDEVIGAHGGRLVKQIGDGVMFAADSPGDGAAIALDLADSPSGWHDLPPVRVGLAFGVVLTHFGDYYGDVVNLAARLVALARPGTAVVDADLADAVGDTWQLERLPDQALKGFGTPATVYRLVARR